MKYFIDSEFIEDGITIDDNDVLNQASSFVAGWAFQKGKHFFRSNFMFPDRSEQINLEYIFH